MQNFGSEIRTTGPRDSSGVVIDANLAEALMRPSAAENRATKGFEDLHLAACPIGKPQVENPVAGHLHRDDVGVGASHGNGRIECSLAPRLDRRQSCARARRWLWAQRRTSASSEDRRSPSTTEIGEIRIRA